MIAEILYFVFLATAFTGTHAHLFGRNKNSTVGTHAQLFDRIKNSTVIQDVGEELSSVNCTENIRAEAQCNLAPFSGTFVCRQFFSVLGYKSLHTVCAPNIVQGFTLGLKSDSCGCCGGKCPEPCGCTCGNNGEKVWVSVKMFFGLLKFQRCVTDGLSQHMTAWGNAAKCISPDEGCPVQTSDAPTAAPSA